MTIKLTWITVALKCCWRWWMFYSVTLRKVLSMSARCRWLYVERAGNKLHPSGKTHLIIKLLRSIIDNVAPVQWSLPRPMFRIKTTLLTLAQAMTKHIWCTSSRCRHWCCMRCKNRTLRRFVRGRKTWHYLPATPRFNFLASHDGIGLNPLRGLLPESEILELVEALQQEGALVNWKNNPDGTRSPYEINVTYMDALSRRESSDEERCASLFSPMRFC